MSQPQSMRALLARDGCLALPGVYDGISARMADSLGFEALYMTGYGVVASALGMADAGYATYTEMLDRVRCIADAIRVPFIADGDTGYGGAAECGSHSARLCGGGRGGDPDRGSGVPPRNAAIPSSAGSSRLMTPWPRSAWPWRRAPARTS